MPTTIRRSGGGWLASDIVQADWRIEATTSERAAVFHASAGIDTEVFSNLVSRIETIVSDGVGFVVVTGLVPPSGSAARTTLVTLASALGQPQPQSEAGDLVVDICDEGLRFSGDVRAYRTRDRLSYHTDAHDWTVLACVRQARVGGGSSVVSALEAHDELARRDESTLEILYKQWHFDRRGAPGPKTFTSPVFARADDQVSCFYVPHTLRSAAVALGRDLPDDRRSALDRFDALLLERGRAHQFRLAPGDIQIVNNYTTLHARGAFEDDPRSRRLLMRIWLRANRARALAPGFKYWRTAAS